MKTNLRNFFGIAGASLILGLTPLVADAANPLTFGDVAMSGSGCPSGTVDVVKDPASNTISFIFSDFAVTAKNNFRRKACNMRIGMELAPGFSISDVSAVYQGFADVKAGGSAAIDSIASVGTTRVGRRSSQLGPGRSGNYTLTNMFGISALSFCGISTNLGLNSTVTARSSNANETQIGIDTIDVGSRPRLDIRFDVIPCN
jgi:hypothetical protein